MKKRYITLFIFAALFALSGCDSAGTSESDSLSAESSKTDVSETTSTAEESEHQSSDSASTIEESGTNGSTSVSSSSDMFTKNDIEIGYDEETSAKITLSGDSATCDSNAVEISGSTVTIKDEGTYILSGTLDNGMIVVNAEKTDKVRLVLNGVQIKNSTSAAIYVAQADKTFITTVSNSENTLTNDGKYVAIDDNNIDAVIYSKDDLTLNGAGLLTINAAGHGVVSKDDLVLTSGTYDITAASHGLSGKDSVRISNGTYAIKSEKDGIHAENSDDAEKGFIYITGGNFSISANGDGISSDEYLTIEDGDFTINTGEGSASVIMPTENFGSRGGFGMETVMSETNDSVSRKGIKTDGVLTVSGGNFKTDTEDDSFHAGENILVNGGSFDIKTGDDAVHSDADVTIKNGDFNITYCYEGIEGQTITVDDGSFNITANDDGFNAAGGADSSGFGGGRPDKDQFNGSSNVSLTINGGTIDVVSDGDCIDSNGALTINGGKFNLVCNGNGNTALDCDGTYSNNGGDITTNDGSESNPGQMGGGMGGHGGKRDFSSMS